jgi:uncharacterized membrane protein YfcA
MYYFLLALCSFLVGIIVGLTGIGGASLITPMLIFLFQVPPAIAISSDVVAATLMKVVGSIKHFQQQTIDLDLVKWLAPSSVIGSLIGVMILHLIRHNKYGGWDNTLLRLLGVMILLVTLFSCIQAIAQLLLINFFPEFNLPELPKLDIKTAQGRLLTLIIGATLGCCVGITSVSSGSMFALFLIIGFRLDAQKLVGTDIAHASILLLFTSLGHLTLGTINWNLVLTIWLGSVPGVLLGAKICQIAPQQPLRFIVYAILMMVSWKLVAPV